VLKVGLGGGAVPARLVPDPISLRS
jgi:hypothetical protein